MNVVIRSMDNCILHIFRGDSYKAAVEEGVRLGLSFERADFRDTNFSGANLAGGHFARADFNRSLLRGTNLSGADLSGASFMDADFTGANLDDAKMKGAGFYHAQISTKYIADIWLANPTQVVERMIEWIQEE
jgi:uncharacterized protein YjbI with pentapeptide repeats